MVAPKGDRGVVRERGAFATERKAMNHGDTTIPTHIRPSTQIAAAARLEAARGSRISADARRAINGRA